MSFNPPTFGSFGKSTKDLFKKKYDFDFSVKSVRKGDDGFTFESSITQTKAGANRGALSIKKKENWGEEELSVNTAKDQESKASVKITKFAGLTSTITASTKDDDFKGSDRTIYTIDNEYLRNNVAATLAFKTNCFSHKLKASAAFGVNDFSVGASTAVDLSSGASVTDYNVGAEFSKPAYTVSAFTERKLENVTLSYYAKNVNKYNIGARVVTDLALKDPKVTVGADTQLCNNTGLKFKAESDTTVSLALDHRVANPALQVGLAASFKPLEFNQSVKAVSFGFNLTAGDF